MSIAEIRGVLQYLLQDLDQLSDLNLDHSTPVARGIIPGDMDYEMCPTGEHEYVLRWKFLNSGQAAKFKDFIASHVSVEVMK